MKPENDDKVDDDDTGSFHTFTHQISWFIYASTAYNSSWKTQPLKPFCSSIGKIQVILGFSKALH